MYTKGGTAGGWVYIQNGKLPIALVHPKYVDKFLAAPAMIEALKGVLLVAIPHSKNSKMVFEKEYIGIFEVLGSRLEQAVEALASAEGKGE